MAQQQTNYHPQTASLHAGDQQWGDNSGAIINNFNNVGLVNYYGGNAYMQGPVTAYTVQNGVSVRQAPGPAPPGFTHMGHGVQQPPFSGTNVQSHMAHVCGSGKGPFNEQEQQIVHALCSSLLERSNQKWDCGIVGKDATRTAINFFLSGHEQLAKDKYWRRAQQNAFQRKDRAEKKQQKDQAKQRDLSQQWPVSTPVYLQQMQTVDDNADGNAEDNAGVLQPNSNMDLNRMLLDHNAGGLGEGQMQQEAPQMPLPHDLDLDVHVDPQLALSADPQSGMPLNPLPVQ